MVESVQPLLEEPCVGEEVAVGWVALVPHVLYVAKIPVEVVFDDGGAGVWFFVVFNKAFGESV